MSEDKGRPLLLELFAGSCSIGKEARPVGFDVISTDVNQFGGIDIVEDILTLDLAQIPRPVSVVWASPPCTGFSVASIGRHWGGGFRAYEPKSETSRLGLRLLRRTLAIIEELDPVVWFMENPRGVMRKMPEVQDLTRHGVTYCQYGDERMKPTDIWTNCTEWTPRPMCKNGAPCHVAAPRGSKTGTQGLKGNYERSIIPPELCREVMEVAMRQVKKSQR